MKENSTFKKIFVLFLVLALFNSVVYMICMENAPNISDIPIISWVLYGFVNLCLISYSISDIK